jgi:uncharacterized membrane protein
MLVSSTIVLLLVTVLVLFLPNVTRPDFLFGVTIDPAFRQTPEARRIVRRFRLFVAVSAGMAIGLALATGHMEWELLQVVGFIISLAIAHRRTMEHAAPPTRIVEADLAAPSEKFPGGIAAALVPAASLGVLALWASSHWDRLPSQIPTHWGLRGPDRWISRTPESVYGWIVISAAVSLLFMLMGWGILHWSRRASPSWTPAAAEGRRFRRLTVQLLVVVGYWMAALAWLALLAPGKADWMLGAVLAIVAVYLVLMIRALRHGAATPAGDRTPDACWKLGIFYFNPADPAVFVAKRFGVGYTFNFANRWSWLMLAALLVVVAAGRLLK